MTPHFKAAEFACRDGTPYPNNWTNERLLLLCQTLEVIRTEVARPIEVLSGYRTGAYNRKVGGARNSQHVQGRAADIRCDGLTAKLLHDVVLGLYRAGRLPHLGGLGLYLSFVHVDVREKAIRLARWIGGRSDAETIG